MEVGEVDTLARAVEADGRDGVERPIRGRSAWAARSWSAARVCEPAGTGETKSAALISDMSAPTDQVGASVTRTMQTMRAAWRSTEEMKANAIASSGTRLSPGLRSKGE